MFLVQGCFFQNQEWIGTRMVPVEGMVAVIERGLLYDFFAGIVHVDPRMPGRLTGILQDHYGFSTLSDIALSSSQFSFLKRYEGRQYDIRYSFSVKDGNTWVGHYEAERVGRGVCRCILTEVEDSFYDPEPIMKLLGVTDAHKW